MEQQEQTRVLSGIQPSGNLHLGNYFAMMKPMVEYQKSSQLYCFIVNYHALTSVREGKILRQGTLDAAMDFLAEEEPFERGWYAGPVGFFDVEGNGVFAPALRMGVMTPGGWRLFAGAGIVEGSVPALEWEETAIKFRPVLEALQEGGVSFPDSGEGARAASSVRWGREVS